MLLNEEWFYGHQLTGRNCFGVLKDLAFPNAPNMKIFAQLATLLRELFKPTCLKIAERYCLRSAVQQQGQSIADFVCELKKLAGTCKFTNEQLNPNLRHRFICGLRSHHIKQKLYIPRSRLSVAFQSEAKVTKETKNQVSPLETRGGATDVVSQITRGITAHSKSSLTKRVICNRNVLTGNPLLSRGRRDNASVSPWLGEHGWRGSAWTGRTCSHGLMGNL